MIKKLKLEIQNHTQSFSIGSLCDVLSVQKQHEGGVVYINDVGEPAKTLEIKMSWTGQDAPPGFKYLGTLLFDGDDYVEHYFWRILS